ncbi:hypothetical protein [Nocardiopsis oceani]
MQEHSAHRIQAERGSSPLHPTHDLCVAVNGQKGLVVHLSGTHHLGFQAGKARRAYDRGA